MLRETQNKRVKPEHKVLDLRFIKLNVQNDLIHFMFTGSVIKTKLTVPIKSLPAFSYQLITHAPA